MRRWGALAARHSGISYLSRMNSLAQVVYHVHLRLQQYSIVLLLLCNHLTSVSVRHPLPVFDDYTVKTLAASLFSDNIS